MTSIVPTITATDPHQYREQMERVTAFAARIHVDISDGVFAPIKLLDLDQTWFPENKTIDLHLMLQEPLGVLEQVVKLKPALVLIHAESDDAEKMLRVIRTAGLKAGVALLPHTTVGSVASLLTNAEHVLIFGGYLGHQGGEADLSLLSKVTELKQLAPNIEIGWDGGVNETNIAQIVAAGVDVLNVGSYIQQAEDPSTAYAKLLALAEA